jgi:hypothetical protein
MERSNKLIKHIGDGKFNVHYDGEVKEAGVNLAGIIRYTYFQDYTLPPIGWEVNWSDLMNDYLPKMQNDVLIGKIKPNEMNW